MKFQNQKRSSNEDSKLKRKLKIVNIITEKYIKQKEKIFFLFVEKMHGASQLGIITLIVILVAAWIFFTYYPLPKYESGNMGNSRYQEVARHLDKMKRLWTERTYLTRMSSIEDLVGYNGSNLTKERLINNNQQLGRNFSHLYGKEAGDKLTELLMKYHQGVFDLLKQIRQKREVAFEFEDLQREGEKIADFLVSKCPDLERNKLVNLFNTQLNELVNSVVYALQDKNLSGMTSFESYNKATKDLMRYIEECVWKNLLGRTPNYM